MKTDKTQIPTILRAALFVAISLSVIGFPPAEREAVAQDWSVSDDRKREIIKRYKTLLERNPTEGLAFRKLLDYVGKGKGLENLIAEYQKKVEEQPDDARYRMILGHFLKAKNDYQGALTQYDKAVELEPDDPSAWLSRGAAHLVLQHEEKAGTDFEKALELEKDRSKKQEILRKLADLAFASRDWERAQKYYDQLVALDPRNEFLRMEYAQVLIKYKRYDKALEQYKALIDLAGRDAKARATTMRDLGDLYEKMGQDEKALETYRDAMKYVRSGNWLHKELRQRIVGVYRRSDRLIELVEEYEKDWRSPNYDQSMELASLYDELGMEEKALSYYERASRKSRRSVDPRLKIIQILERRGKDKEVISEYKQLIRIAPQRYRFQFDLVRLYFRIGDRKAAEKMLDRIESRFRRDPDVHVTLADTYMRFDMREDALRIYKKLVRMDPRNDAYILGLGEYYYQAGELDKAVDTWVKLLDSSLEEAEAHGKLGQVLAEHGLVEKGLSHFEKAVEIAPDDTGMRRGLALAYERARRWQNAIDEWNTILEKADQPFIANEARSRIINVYRRQNRLRTKMREFEKEFDQTPPDIRAGFFLAESHVKLGDFEEAEKVYNRIQEIAAARDDAKRFELDALASLEKLYQQTKNWEKAIEVLQRLAELKPAQSREYYHRIAELSLKLYQDDQAVHYATLAVQLNPDDAMAQARLGDVYYKMEKLESAAAQYRAAIDLDPRAFEIQMKLAEILVDLGQYEEAEKLYRRVAKKGNDETLIGKAARQAMALAETEGGLVELEAEFYPLVYRTPPRDIYRKIMLEIFDRLTSPLVQKDRYGVESEREGVSRQLDEISQRALPVLVDAVQSRDVSQRALAVRLIGDLRQGNAALSVARLVDDPAEPLRMVAAVTVAQIGDPRAAAPLIRAAADSDPTIRELAIWALGGVGGDAATTKLAEVLEKGQSWREQALAAIGLGRVGGKDSVRALVNYYGKLGANRYADYIAVALVWALGRTGSADTIPVLRDALQKGSSRVAGVASWSLAAVGGDEAMRALLQAYWGDSRLARERAARGINVFGVVAPSGDDNRRRVEEIRRETRLVDDRERFVDVESILTRLEEQAGIAVERGKASDSVLEQHKTIIADEARKAIQAGRSSMVFGDLTNELGQLALGPIEPESEAGQSAMRDVAEAMVDELEKAAGPRSSDRAEAVAVLGALGRDQDRQNLEMWVRSDDPEVRLAAVRGLANYDGDKIKGAIVGALQDNRFDVRVEAARAMGQAFTDNPDPKAVGALTQALQDKFDSVKTAAARALGEMNAESAIGDLVALLEGARVPVKIAVLESLHRFDNQRAERALEIYSRHLDPRLRAAATRQTP